MKLSSDFRITASEPTVKNTDSCEHELVDVKLYRLGSDMLANVLILKSHNLNLRSPNVSFSKCTSNLKTKYAK
jgi:hypothetical protein